MRASAFVYPWDVVGDPAAPERIAALGVAQVTLAAAYHSTRALTPRHPRHRVVTAEHAAVLYPTDEHRWRDRELRPYAAGAWAPGDAWGEAAAALRAAGLDVHTWVVLAHNSRMGRDRPDTSVVNAYGDRYPWAPCIAQPAVRAYLVELAAEAATRPGASGTELESLGWYGLAHLHAHDKIGGVPLGDAEQYLMSLCFCPHCRAGYADRGVDGERLAAAVRRGLAPHWAGRGTAPGAVLDAPVGAALLGDADLAAAVLDWRTRQARSLQEAVVAAVRAAAEPGFQVLMHADPAPYRCGANAGVDAAHILGVADGLVLPCTGDAAAREAVLGPAARHARRHTVLAANFTVVRGMGGSPATLAADAAHAASLGATELRLYHAGLAAEADLALVREALAGL
ncbi:hypothetical protein VSR01_07490 [Actinacidiphila sp. DG2A-62]|uniref:hypothetical protein n=1 Tax=Actinacidiphila sp. DG2A-62 TaxID=3108821 RepID=UPI002DBAD3CE|nr:hypothetical protein [Actinacidiphila sp. DG2A-62]MEC3993394.1 hypothetical protein [Actinacidiphila sp. DG2A-62]